MISKIEIESKSREFEINTADVERDYVFGWLLSGIFSQSNLKELLILKGGNCFRKAYFSETRFSKDLDFSTPGSIDHRSLIKELNHVCDYVQERSGVIFDKDRNKVEEKLSIDTERVVHEAKLYFKDFYGNPKFITISVRLDITEFDRLYLPVQKRFLIHSYSDSEECRAEIRCVKLEEALATKLKCLMQRRHLFDLYDLVYSVFINKEIEVKRSEIVTTFLKKTIFEPSPGIVRDLLLGLPFEVFRAVWSKYLVCPRPSFIGFDAAIQFFKQIVEELFGGFRERYGRAAFFPAEFRNPIIDAGSTMTLLEVVYDGRKRLVEPYSLIFKRREDGIGREYFYVYDRTGGWNSGPGIKSFVQDKIESINSTTEKFIPQRTVELSKAGEYGEKTTFASTRHRSHSSKIRRRTGTTLGRRIYTIQCNFCSKRFRRSKYSTRLGKHQDKFGNRCYGRRGQIIS